MENNADRIAMSMLAVAETMRIQQPPKYKMAIKCVRAASRLILTPYYSAHVQLQLGKLLLLFTENLEEAGQCLEEAYKVLITLGDPWIQHRLEALTLLCELYINGIPSTSNLHSLMERLRNDWILAKNSPEYCTKLLLYYVEAATLSGLGEQAAESCEVAIKTVRDFDPDGSLELYFRITKYMVLHKFREIKLSEDESHIIGKMVMDVQQKSNPSVVANLKLFFVGIQLAAFTSEGQTRSSKGLLRMLQTEIPRLNELTTTGPCGIRWMDSIPMTVFACLITMAAACFQCNFEKALKYYGVGMRHVNEYLAKAARAPCEYGILRAVQRMRLALNEMMTHLNILACRPNSAMENIRDMVQFCRSGASLEIVNEFAPIVQSLLGLYSIYLKDLDLAERHMISALKLVQFKNGRDKNVWMIANANLGLFYLSQCRQSAFYEIAEELSANRVSACSLTVQQNVKFVQAFHAYLCNKYPECKALLLESMDAAKQEDMFRLHSLGILLLSNFMSLTSEVLLPAIDWGHRGHDHMLHMWSNQILLKLLTNQPPQQQQETLQKIEIERQRLDRDNLLADHRKNPACQLIEYFDGDPSPYLPNYD